MTHAWHPPLPAAAPSFLPVPELLSRHHPPLPSPSLSSCFPVRFHPPTQHYPFEQVPSGHNLQLNFFVRLLRAWRSPPSRQLPPPGPNCDWQPLRTTAPLLSSSPPRPFRKKHFFQSQLLSWLSPSSHQTADYKRGPENVFRFSKT